MRRIQTQKLPWTLDSELLLSSLVNFSLNEYSHFRGTVLGSILLSPEKCSGRRQGAGTSTKKLGRNCCYSRWNNNSNSTSNTPCRGDISPFSSVVFSHSFQCHMGSGKASKSWPHNFRHHWNGFSVSFLFFSFLQEHAFHMH